MSALILLIVVEVFTNFLQYHTAVDTLGFELQDIVVKVGKASKIVRIDKAYLIFSRTQRPVTASEKLPNLSISQRSVQLTSGQIFLVEKLT